jgi:hypothetical protein
VDKQQGACPRRDKRLKLRSTGFERFTRLIEPTREACAHQRLHFRAVVVCRRENLVGLTKPQSANAVPERMTTERMKRATLVLEREW